MQIDATVDWGLFAKLNFARFGRRFVPPGVVSTAAAVLESDNGEDGIFFVADGGFNATKL